MNVFLSTADASGDLHAAALVEALSARARQRGEQLRVYGLGGSALEAAGMEVVVQQSELAVAGLVEVLGSAGRLVRSYTTLRSALRERQPDLAILVDSPDLNLPLASVAKRAGVPVLYYIAPQIWAWRPGRVRKLRRRVDHVGVIFPFEQTLLRESGVAATFVGHPLVDRIETLKQGLRRKETARELGLDLERPVLGLLPGSRWNEVAGNLPILLEASELICSAHPGLQVCLLLAPTLAERPPLLPDHVRMISGRTHEAMALSTLLIVAPGTVTIEAALLGVPFIVTHTLSRLSFEIARRISRVPSACMVNLIADRGVVSERIQEMARPAAIAAESARLLRDAAARESLRDSLRAATAGLGSVGASERAADLALQVAGRL